MKRPLERVVFLFMLVSLQISSAAPFDDREALAGQGGQIDGLYRQENRKGIDKYPKKKYNNQ